MVFGRRRLLEEVWGYQIGAGERTVDSHVRAIRRKLGHSLIRTVHGIGYALDTNGLSDLKKSAKAGSPEALKGAATQFEAMFVNMMMKSMRDATPQDGPMDSQETKTYTTMLDQQMSQKLAKRGIGLADVLVRQLSTEKSGQALAKELQ